MLPFLQAKGFVGEAFAKGGEALNRMRQAPCHLLLLELECGDLMGIDLARGAKQEGIAGATLLVDDPMKSGMIISALARGVDNFVATPPDEAIFFSRIEGMLLAQWGLVVHQQQGQMVEELARVRQQLVDVEAKEAAAETVHRGMLTDLDKQLSAEKRRVAELVKETKVLRDQLTTMHLLTGAKTGHSDEGQAARSDEGDGADDDESVDFLLDDMPMPKAASSKPVAKAVAPPPPAPAPPAKAPPAKAPPPMARAAAPAPPAPRPAPPTPQPAPALKPAPPPPAPSFGALDDFDRFGSDDAFDESTQAIPADIAASLMAEAALVTSSTTRKPAATMPSMPSLDPSHPELEDFSDAPATVTFSDDGDARTMAMTADVASLLIGATAKGPARPASADFGFGDDDAAGGVLGDLDSLPTDGKGFAQPDDDDDSNARTVAIPRDVAQAAMAQRRAPGPAPSPAAFDFEDEKTPAAGLGRAPAVPAVAAFKSNDDSTAPGGIDVSTFDMPKVKKPSQKTLANLDSQIMRDLAGIPSADAEEVLFADDD